MRLRNLLPTPKTTVLAVDDNQASLDLIQMILQNGDYTVLTAVNGRHALEVLHASGDTVDLILLDRVMPEMDGIEFCRRIKADEKFRALPIIMQTAAGRPQEIREGIEAGVFYYLLKPLEVETLLSIVASAKDKVRKYRQDKNEHLQRQESISMVRSMECVFRTVEEGEMLAAFLAPFFPNPDLTLTGISELFLNAVEHGNLAISYELKSQLVRANTWRDEVNRRLSDPRFRDRAVTVTFSKKNNEYTLQIEDEGEGFNWQDYLQVDTARVTHNHGRGIAMSNMMSFDELIYNDRGNQVTAVVHFAR